MSESNSADDLCRLATLCPPPRNPVPLASSRPGAGGQAVPASHRELTRTYGTGCFDEFLWVFAGGASNSHLDIADRTEQMWSIFRGKQLNKLGRVLGERHAVPEDLVQWGVTDNADLLAWITEGEPDSWPTVIIQAGQLDAVVSPSSSTATVQQLLTGSLRVPFFPDDFPSNHPEFSVNPYA